MTTRAQFTLLSFFWRLLFASTMVVLTYNPSGYSYVDWVWGAWTRGELRAEYFFVGVVLLIGWSVFIRATFFALGLIGLVLWAAFLGTLVWVLSDYGLLEADSLSIITWISLLCISALLAIGTSWSHIRRRLTGQIDVDDVES